MRSSMEEVKHTFIIKTVTDPRTQKSISLHEAIRDGIIDNATSKTIYSIISDLQVRGDIEGNPEILFPISLLKHML